MRPFGEDELAEVVDRIPPRSPILADVTLIAGWTGLRWGGAAGVSGRGCAGAAVAGVLGGAVTD